MASRHTTLPVQKGGTHLFSPLLSIEGPFPAFAWTNSAIRSFGNNIASVSGEEEAHSDDRSIAISGARLSENLYE